MYRYVYVQGLSEHASEYDALFEAIDAAAADFNAREGAPEGERAAMPYPKRIESGGDGAPLMIAADRSVIIARALEIAERSFGKAQEEGQ